MDEQWIAVGERISRLRKNLGLTQEKLAEQADISIQFLVQIEHGKRTMKIGTLRKLSVGRHIVPCWFKDILRSIIYSDCVQAYLRLLRFSEALHVRNSEYFQHCFGD